MFDLLQRYRPTRTTDGEGGFTEAVGDASNIHAALEVHQNELSLSFINGEDVNVLDQVLVGGAYYRVTGWIGSLMATHRRASVERIARPIVP